MATRLMQYCSGCSGYAKDHPRHRGFGAACSPQAGVGVTGIAGTGNVNLSRKDVIRRPLERRDHSEGRLGGSLKNASTTTGARRAIRPTGEFFRDGGVGPPGVLADSSRSAAKRQRFRVGTSTIGLKRARVERNGVHRRNGLSRWQSSPTGHRGDLRELELSVPLLERVRNERFPFGAARRGLPRIDEARASLERKGLIAFGSPSRSGGWRGGKRAGRLCGSAQTPSRRGVKRGRSEPGPAGHGRALRSQPEDPATVRGPARPVFFVSAQTSTAPPPLAPEAERGTEHHFFS